MKKNILFLILSALLILIVSCDGTVLRDVVDAKEASGIIIYDYCGAPALNSYKLSSTGLSDPDGTIILSCKDLPGMRNAAYLSEYNFLILDANGNLYSWNEISKTKTKKSTNCVSLTHTGYWVTKSDTLFTVHYGNSSEYTTFTDSVFESAYESDGKLLISSKTGSTRTLRCFGLDTDKPICYLEEVFGYGVVYGYIQTSDTDFVITYDKIYNITTDTDAKTYSNSSNPVNGFAYVFDNDLIICYQNNSEFYCYNTCDNTGSTCLTDNYGTVLEVFYEGSDCYIGTTDGDLYKVNTNAAIPTATGV